MTSEHIMRFKSKVILVVGGNSGIGLSSAKAFADEGGTVILTGRSQKTINAAVAAIPGSKGFSVDIANINAFASFIDTLGKQHPKIDVLFVNAGVGAFAPVREITPELWDEVHSINLKGCFFAVQKALPLLGKGSSIVLTGSVGSEAAVAGNAVYASSKAGLRAITRILAKELVSEGIRVNMVSPGPTETPLLHRNIGMDEAAVDGLRQIMISIVPMGRMGTPEEIAKTVLFLASEEASFITGADLFVDGGALELK
jgi:NAD(P)-dependent dehydrogenase (short-subunit alcohol dehydrogenase family)